MDVKENCQAEDVLSFQLVVRFTHRLPTRLPLLLDNWQAHTPKSD